MFLREPIFGSNDGYRRSLGFGLAGEQYKIVMLSGVRVAHVLTVRSGEWRLCADVPPWKSRAETTFGDYIHWVSADVDVVIWRFDIDNEIFTQLLNTPADIFEKSLHSNYAPPQLGIVDGKLCIYPLFEKWRLGESY
ncbi:hypothetical protein L1987_25210 [Smallanthus sonchifolius]|uniref:Uncharacterized protein n=1 Tax=Smallanthus sonchifolius TaxID=185202 RepID=A0ACB9IPC9_9ASTR|nr:hypothetical protein L1987_25210 [Smallanthus sonchifolius]